MWPDCSSALRLRNSLARETTVAAVSRLVLLSAEFFALYCGSGGLQTCCFSLFAFRLFASTRSCPLPLGKFLAVVCSRYFSLSAVQDSLALYRYCIFIFNFNSFLSSPHIISCSPHTFNTCTLCKPLPLMKAAASCWNVWYFKENLWLVISTKEPWSLLSVLLRLSCALTRRHFVSLEHFLPGSAAVLLDTVAAWFWAYSYFIHITSLCVLGVPCCVDRTSTLPNFLGNLLCGRSDLWWTFKTADISHSLYLLQHHCCLFLHHLQPYHSWSVCLLLQLNLNVIALCTVCMPKN